MQFALLGLALVLIAVGLLGVLPFTVFWALWHRMWLVSFFLVLASTLLSALEFFGANPPAVFAASAGLFLIVGFFGNDWRRRKLRQQGYRFDGIVAADAVDGALRRWYDRNPPDRALSVSSY